MLVVNSLVCAAAASHDDRSSFCQRKTKLSFTLRRLMYLSWHSGLFSTRVAGALAVVLNRTIKLGKVDIPAICFNDHAVLHVASVRGRLHFLKGPDMPGRHVKDFFSFTRIRYGVPGSYGAACLCRSIGSRSGFGLHGGRFCIFVDDFFSFLIKWFDEVELFFIVDGDGAPEIALLDRR